MSERIPAETFPAHEFMADEMSARGWSDADMAARCDLSEQEVERIRTRGTWAAPYDRELPEIAKAFGEVSAQSWVNLFDAAMLGALRDAAEKDYGI
jgi:plasmid maintenance system antidote protein VapI